FKGYKTELKFSSKEQKNHSSLETEYLSKFPNSPNYPYLKSAPVEEFSLKEKTYFVRMHNSNNDNLDCVMSLDDLQSLKEKGTLANLSYRLALPNHASKRSLEEVPANETVRKSVAGPQIWNNGPQNQGGGLTQNQIL